MVISYGTTLLTLMSNVSLMMTEKRNSEMCWIVEVNLLGWDTFHGAALPSVRLYESLMKLVRAERRKMRERKDREEGRKTDPEEGS